MVRRDRFDRHALIECRLCHRRTRETGAGEGELRLCKVCIFETYAENAASDYGEDSPQHRDALRQYEQVKAEVAKRERRASPHAETAEA